VSSVCTVIPVISMDMFNYTLQSKKMIAFKNTRVKAGLLRLLTPLTQFAQSIIEGLVANGRIRGNDHYTALQLGHRLLSFILSCSMVLVSLICLCAYRSSDFDEVSELKLRCMSSQRLPKLKQVKWSEFERGEMNTSPMHHEKQFVSPDSSWRSCKQQKSDLSEKLLQPEFKNDISCTQLQNN